VLPADYDPRVQRYVYSELDSGERVVTERIRNVRSVAIGFWIGAGSRDERNAKAGASHFIEHLLFKGSHSYSAQDIASIFDRLGGELNAATSREHTVVYARVPDDRLDIAIEVMGDMVFAPLFAELDAEREVVLEEIAMYEDTPQEFVHDLISEAVFGRHALGRPVVGSAAVISSISRRSLASYHRAMYAPGNIVVAAVGNLEHDRLVALLEQAERKAQDPPAPRPIRSPLVRPPAPGLRFQRKDTEQYHVCLAAPGIARSDRRRFVVSLLDAILGGSASSRLFQEIREKRGMAYSVYTFASQYTDTGQVGLYVGTREDNLRECLDVATAQILDIAAGNLAEDELERAKENLKSRIMLSMESTSNRMSRLGKSLITNTEILSVSRVIAEIEAVTIEAVAELAGLLLSPERLSAAGIGPREDRFLRAVERVSPALVARAAA
jgi:predicted Zn-dependent peptidase